MKEVLVKSRDAWRRWLEKNHEASNGIWLVFFKKHKGVHSLGYDDAVEEALCFGWIDSIIKKCDDESYVRKFTPRKSDSRWSKLNKKRVTKLIKQGRMTDAGQAKVVAAKKSGRWTTPARPELSFEMPEALRKALRKSKKAKAFFEQLAPTYKKQFIGWITVAKRQETKERRVSEAIALLEKGKKLGLK